MRIAAFKEQTKPSTSLSRSVLRVYCRGVLKRVSADRRFFMGTHGTYAVLLTQCPHVEPLKPESQDAKSFPQKVGGAVCGGSPI